LLANSKAEHMAASTKACDAKILLTNLEPPTHGPPLTAAWHLVRSSNRELSDTDAMAETSHFSAFAAVLSAIKTMSSYISGKHTCA
jgi:hypothetical protein